MLRIIAVTASSLLLAGLFATSRAAAPRFYPDDPLWSERDSEDASNVQPYEIDLEYDALENMFDHPGDKATNVRAQNVNTVDEVPDSSWYTNRAGRRPLFPEDIASGPNITNGPAAGRWTVLSAKANGVSPGFVIRDREGVDWFLKFDPPGFRGMATGAEVLSGRLLWALGYHVPELHIASLRPEELIIDSRTTIRTSAGKRSMRRGDVADALSRAARDADGSYRVLASRRVDGKPLGGFRFYGTRPDDPNDYVPHEHRRELRAYGTFAAWLHHVDAKSINSFDALVTENGATFVRHYLLDFGSTIGSAGIRPREPFEGWEYLVDGSDAVKNLLSFGLRIAPWRTLPMFRAPAVGAFPSENLAWDPDRWKPRYPNAAFLRARPDDKFWAASKLRALTPDLLRAAVETAQFGDADAERAVLRFLIERRIAILRRYLTAVNPISEPALGADGRLTFANTAVDTDVARLPDAYHARWLQFDNATHETNLLGESVARQPVIDTPAALPRVAGTYVKVEISAASHEQPAWADPVHAYFRHEGDRWALVGFERMPQGNPPTPFSRIARAMPHAAAETERGPAASSRVRTSGRRQR
jgi:hypothetical protein